jgi:hypothetical protein
VTAGGVAQMLCLAKRDSRTRCDRRGYSVRAGRFRSVAPRTPTETPTPPLEKLNLNGPALTDFRK